MVTCGLFVFFFPLSHQVLVDVRFFFFLLYFKILEWVKGKLRG